MHLAKSTENKPLSRGGNNTFIFITLGARCKREQLTHSWAPLSKHPMKPQEWSSSCLITSFQPSAESRTPLSAPSSWADHWPEPGRGQGQAGPVPSPQSQHLCPAEPRLDRDRSWGPSPHHEATCTAQGCSCRSLCQEHCTTATNHRSELYLCTALFPFDNTNLFNLFLPPQSSVMWSHLVWSWELKLGLMMDSRLEASHLWMARWFFFLKHITSYSSHTTV